MKLVNDSDAEGIGFIQCTALSSSDKETSEQALELINALKFDKLSYPSVLRIRSMWIDAVFGSLMKKRNVDAVQSYLKALKTNLIVEFTATIQQVEKDSFLFTGEIL